MVTGIVRTRKRKRKRKRVHKTMKVVVTGGGSWLVDLVDGAHENNRRSRIITTLP